MSNDQLRPVLEMRGISKTFPGVKALNGVQLKAWGGEVLALMGENGAGKSTLMKILSGAYHADAGGEILIDGQPVQITDPIAAKRAGIAIIYQELSLAPNLTVAENIYLGDELHERGIVNRKAMADGCRPVLERLARRVREVDVPAGHTFIREGEPGESFYAIVDGEVLVTAGGKQIARLGPGDYVGEIALLRDVPRQASVSAVTDTLMLALEREPFLEAVTGSGRAAEVARSGVEQRLAELEPRDDA